MRFPALAVLFVTFVLTLAAGGAAMEPSLLFATLTAGDRSAIQTPTQVVVRTAAEWQTLWRRHTAALTEVPAPPRVDFTREMVIAVFAGRVESSTRMSILRITREANRLVVLVRMAETQPGPEPVGTGVRTPFHIVRIARSSLPVVFVRARAPDIY